MLESMAPPQAADGPARPPHVVTRRAVTSWVLYDLANTIFSMGVVSLYFSLWVRDQVGANRADSVYGLITAVSMGVIFLVSPLLGAMTDRAPRRMPFLVTSTLICVFFTANDAFIRDYRLVIPGDCVVSQERIENQKALAYMKRVVEADIRPSDKLDPAKLIKRGFNRTPSQPSRNH